MRVIGITGGVGSGKSEILRLLKEEFGAKLLMADDIAHEVMAPGGEASRRIEEAFGADYLKPDKSVDRQKMAELIFKDADALETMNSIVHPAVWRRIEEGIQTASEKLVAVEAALFDEEHNRMFDEVWYLEGEPDQPPDGQPRLQPEKMYGHYGKSEVGRRVPGHGGPDH